ncbi:pyruvate carboxylase [Thiosocius teredinicola]|uniref:pyruvate carboxylase n=1 Tax=Thiosocius teredinicola TaxID=1973002 RepID=UPI000990FD3F
MPIKPFKKLLVANRSEIAIRIFRAANELGIKTVAVFAQEDRLSMHRFKADEAYQLDAEKGPVGAYLDIAGILEIAVAKGVDAIHPGYGFLSENPRFAQACADNGITFIGPRADLLAQMGDKTAARELAQRAEVPTLPGTEEPVEDRETALAIADQIGFPLIIKAAHGGGGRGMRVVRESKDLGSLLDEARTEAHNAFGNGAVFLERFIQRAKHIEIQILGDRHGNVVHLHERDCSVQRRHQKVIEVAPSVDLAEETRAALCDAAVRLAREIGYDNAGTAEFLVDVDSGDWFFIEMNPRIQVEHTVTEEITNIDLVRSQILVASGRELHGPDLRIPVQEEIPRSGYAIQCRITTEDPENGFAPDVGRLLTYRSPAGFGVRLDAAMATNGAVVSPYYDSLLVKLTVRSLNWENALERTHRALREFRIRGVKTNIPFLENMVQNETFRAGQATTRLIDTTPSLFEFKPRRDRASKLLSYLGDVIVNGNPHAKGWKPEKAFEAAPVPHYDHMAPLEDGTRALLQQLGPKGFADWALAQQKALFTDTTLRDAHQSLLATRMRTDDMLRVAEVIAHKTPNLFSLEMWGGATFDTAMRFLNEDPWERLAKLRELIPNICFQMLLRGANAVGYSNYPDNVVDSFVRRAVENGMDIFRIFDSLNYIENLFPAMEAVLQDGRAVCEAAICYTGNILDPKRNKYDLKYYVDMAKTLEQRGAHFLAIKDMAGILRPYAADQLFRALKDEISIPIHFHTHDTSGINAASVLRAVDAGVDVVDGAIAGLSGCTSQPNLNSMIAALEHTARDPGINRAALDEMSHYWEHVRSYYKPFDTSAPHGTAEVYLHELPGGQFTNLKEQASAMGLGARWPEVARTYAEVNELFGDIVKVTPSSKVVGDMAIFLVTRGIKAQDVLNLAPGSVPFPESVIDMLAGGLGQPKGGWPKDLQQVVLGDRKPIEDRPGLHAEAVDFQVLKFDLVEKLGREPSDEELLSYLMYPQVFRDFDKIHQQYGDLSVLPTPAFFYGLCCEEEIAVEIEPGKTLFIKLLHVGEPDKHGKRSVIFELNGDARHIQIQDRNMVVDVVTRPKADPDDPREVGAPIPGKVSEIAVSVGHKVAKGDPLFTLEAMKMYTTVNAPMAGVVKSIEVEDGATVEAKDLLLRLS